jgi:hypothetical protein
MPGSLDLPMGAVGHPRCLEEVPLGRAPGIRGPVFEDQEHACAPLPRTLWFRYLVCLYVERSPVKSTGGAVSPTPGLRSGRDRLARRRRWHGNNSGTDGVAHPERASGGRPRGPLPHPTSAAGSARRVCRPVRTRVLAGAQPRRACAPGGTGVDSHGERLTKKLGDPVWVVFALLRIEAPIGELVAVPEPLSWGELPCARRSSVSALRQWWR